MRRATLLSGAFFLSRAFLLRRGRHLFVVVQFLFVDFVAGRIYARKRDQALYCVNSFLEIEFRCIFVPYIDNILVASNYKHPVRKCQIRIQL